jgi:putative heme iron utilization protein
MNRPNEHGGGEAAPPIAGDPGSFPTDAELSRTLVARQNRATLCTLTAEGYPYGSAVSYAADDEGAPVVLISEMAEHTVNIRGDNRSSILVAAEAPNQDDPLSTARLTLVGRLELLDDPGDRRDVYLARHPYASYYADFTDFGFWRLSVEQCRFVGGFGHMSWVTSSAYAAATVDPLVDSAEEVITHMNDDHAEANLAYARAQGGLVDATDANMVGIDRYGVTVQATTPAGPRLVRVPFPAPLTTADEARGAVIALLDAARASLAG